MSLIALVLLVAAVVLVAAAEWPRLRERLGLEAREERRRAKRKAQFRVISGTRGRRDRDVDVDLDSPLDEPEPADDFAASVQRDLENLPVVDPHDDRS